MKIAIITGSTGLIGSESARFFCNLGFTVVGIDNNMRKYFFGEDGSTEWNKNLLEQELGDSYIHKSVDIRNGDQISKIFDEYNSDIKLIIHCAAQPSHDWSAKEPLTDFTVNANGTLNLLESTRKYCKESPFIFCSTNKVYGDTPNTLPLIEQDLRWEIDNSRPRGRRWCEVC